MQKKIKRLAIISDCVHMFNSQGNVVTEVHIFCRQMQAIASLFEQTVICCPFVPYSNDTTVTQYTAKNISFIPLKNVGGNSLKSKLALFANIPAWLKGFIKARRNADVVYLRFPNNLNIVSFFYFYANRTKTFASYTGTWANYNGEPLTYRFQKWILKHLFKGPAWVYITEDKAGKNLFKGISPSYTLAEWEEETEQVKNRIEKLKLSGLHRPCFITVGALNANKNQQYILNAFKILKAQGFDFYLYVVGDGQLKTTFERFVQQNGLGQNVNICGKKTYGQLRELYRECNFLVQATLVEGFGKVPIEGFFHGVVPLLSRVALASEMTGNGERGFVYSASDVNNLVDLVKKACGKPAALETLIANGREYAKKQTLEAWAQSYVNTVNEYFN